MHTGMGASFDLATFKKSAAKNNKASTIYDPTNNMFYHSYYKDSAMYMTEFRLQGKDTIFRVLKRLIILLGQDNILIRT